MAAGYGCADDSCDRTVNWIVTRTDPSGTFAVCPEHFPVFLIPVLASELGVDPMRLYESVKRFTDREAAREAKLAAAAPAKVVAVDTDSIVVSEPDQVDHDDEDLADEHEETGLFHGSGEEAL